MVGGWYLLLALDRLDPGRLELDTGLLCVEDGGRLLLEDEAEVARLLWAEDARLPAKIQDNLK